MSEYISTCPQCRQRILCDTQYTGQRVACPLCLQEITMPAPPSSVAPAASRPAAPAVAAPAPQRGAGARRGVPLSVVAVGVGVLILAAGGVWFLMDSPKPAAPVTPVPVTPVAVTPVVAAPVAVAPVRKPQTAATAEDCRAEWKFDADSGNTAVDATGNGYNLRLEGSATFARDPKRGGVLSLSNHGAGDANFAQTAGPVVDTTRSFTVAAWVNFNTVENWETVVSIDGKQVSGFYLQFNHAEQDRLAFNRLGSDAAAAKAVMAKSTFVPVAHTWYHMAGVYDADAKTLSLYVNGQWQSTVPFTTPWLASGRTAVGRGLYNDNRDFLNGMVDDVRIYASALSAAQIHALSAQ